MNGKQGTLHAHCALTGKAAKSARRHARESVSASQPVGPGMQAAARRSSTDETHGRQAGARAPRAASRELAKGEASPGAKQPAARRLARLRHGGATASAPVEGRGMGASEKAF